MAQAMSFSEKGEKMELSQLKIPTHVSIIMDGNGRWAKSKGMPRTYGHSKGADVLMDICEDADALGIKYLTVYAFSTENWSRPETEVKTLMFLFRKYIKISGRASVYWRKILRKIPVCSSKSPLTMAAGMRCCAVCVG